MGGVISMITFRQQTPLIPSRQVRTRYGVVEGFRMDIENEKQVDIFLGVPFAKPPVGKLRFKKPEPPSDWEDVKKCIRFGPRAPQSDFFWEKWTIGVGKSEDCLYLNVFSPTWKAPSNEEKFAVMVFVHGGGYLIDSAVKYGDEGIARYLCRHDVVVVTIQYRLGLLGFFSTGDENCPGNLGLWDQTMALQWVQDNIHAFGGDPRRVTVFGQSAGGASVDLLSLSPHSRNLFHQVIPMAGNAECEWATVSKTRLVDACRRFSERRGCGFDSYHFKENAAMIDYLRKRRGKEFERGLIGRKGVDVSKIGLDLAPVIGNGPSDFLPKPISELRKEAPKKNIMIGTCEHEGLLFAVLAPTNFDTKGIDRLLSIVITEEMHHSDFEELRQKARDIYLKDVDLHDKHAVSAAYVRLYSDIFVVNGTSNYAQIMTKLGHKVFLYSFNYHNPRSFGILSIRTPFKGATHCTELAYLFGVSIVFNFKFNEADRKMLDLMTRMWTNFAKYGNPNGPYEDSTVFDFKWEPATAEKPLRYLEITEKCEMKDDYEKLREEFWKTIRISAKNT